MQLLRLRVEGLRCLASAELEWSAGLNLLTGGNGAGKTSVIEAIHLLGYGRSFRGRVREGMVQSGAAQLSLYAEWCDGGARTRRAGLRHTGGSWEARLDASPCATLAELCAQFAVVTFEPGSHELIAGPAEHRRRYLDWMLFHVEPAFLEVWRRYGRALKQRNALLKSQPSMSQLASWDVELSESGERLASYREQYLGRLDPILADTAGRYLPELGRAHLDYQPGWRRSELSLADALLLQRDRDLGSGFTSVGPHRGDWSVGYTGLPGREVLSRGQEKLTALACTLAQARAFAEDRGEWPIICLDDLASELDRAHQRRVLDDCLASGAQLILTGTERPMSLPESATVAASFHVERGVVSRA